MRAVVTGAAGFIGSHLCERLLRDGSDVVGIDSFTDYYDRSLKEENLLAARSHPDFELREDDLLTTDLHRLLEGVDVVYHLAAQPGVRGSWGQQFDVYVRNNVLATQRLLESMLGRSNVIRFVYSSSSSVYGAATTLPTGEDAPTKPMSPYGVSKLAGEHLVSLYGVNRGLPVAIVRYFTVYGPRQRPDMAFTRFIRAALSGEEAELLGDGEQSRDLTFVEDAVDATVRAAEAEQGAVFNVGGGTRATINEAIAIIEESTGKPISIRRRDVAAGDVPHTWADTTRARTELGWVPSTELKDGLAKQIEWLKRLLGAES